MISLAALSFLLAHQAKPLQERMTMSSGTVVRVAHRLTAGVAPSKAAVKAHPTIAPVSGADILKILGGSMAGVHVVGGPMKFTASAMAVPGVGAMDASNFFVSADPGGDGWITCDLGPGTQAGLSFYAQNTLKDSQFLIVLNLRVVGSAKITFNDYLSPAQEASVTPGEDHVAFFMKSNPSGLFAGYMAFETKSSGSVAISSVQAQPFK